MHYSREDACRVWLSVAEISSSTFEQMLENLGSAEGVYDAVQRHGDKPLKNCGLSSRQCGILLEEAERKRMHDRLVLLQKNEIGLLQQEDERFPELLRQLNDPPWMLYWRGELNCLLGRHLAIVGTRKSSDYGVNVTRHIAEDLSRSGVCIVSGMAPGIDTAAHDGCMMGTSPTIGLAGCGLERPKPLGREGLDQDIIEHGGLVLSEYPPGVGALPYHFPTRNRLISGLSDGLLFMEGRIRSGGMITVGCALDQGKDVLAFPGSAGQEGSEGPLQIIREGATLIRDAADILADMGWEDAASAPKVMESLPPLDPDQRTVLSLLTVEELSFDQLTFKTGLDASKLNAALTLLELSGLIMQSPGRIYRKA